MRTRIIDNPAVRKILRCMPIRYHSRTNSLAIGGRHTKIVLFFPIKTIYGWGPFSFRVVVKGSVRYSRGM